MSDRSYRIKANINGDDNVLYVNLKQGVKTLNILSLDIDTVDTYEKHTSDYGVIVGRVLANNSFGVPNVKVSVFIPITQDDEDDYIISNEYPFKTPQSRDINGVKYNLLHQKKGKAGTFPSKEMLLDNNGCIEVFDKYWKYTATTNESGDYMIFGVPVGSCQVHYDCDLSDIGILSQHPYDLIAKGYDANLFKSKYEFTDEDLDRAVHIISQDKTVYVYPFWGDKDENKIGITRNDININYEFTPSCIFIGSSITDAHGSYIGTEGQPNGGNGKFASLATSTGNIEIIRKTQDGLIEEVKDNVIGIIDGNGVWCYQIPMNLDRIGTDEYGNIVPVNDPNKGIPTRARVRFRISLTDAMDENTSEYTAKVLVPCNPPLKANEELLFDDSYPGRTTSYDKYRWNRLHKPFQKSFDPILDEARMSADDYANMYEFGQETPESCFRDLYWGKVYSVKQYIPRFQYEYNPKNIRYGEDRIDVDEDIQDWEEGLILNEDEAATYDFRGYSTRYSFFASCISSTDIINGLNTFPYTTMYAGAEEHVDFRTGEWFLFHFSDFSEDYSLTERGLHFCFENDWINGTIYFPRVIIRRNSATDYDYFGKLNDEDADYNYEHVYLSGRHHWYFGVYGGKDGDVEDRLRPFHRKLQLLNYANMAFWGHDIEDYRNSAFQNQVSIFSRCSLTKGIITKKTTKFGESVFYYRSSCDEKYKLFITNNIDEPSPLPDNYWGDRCTRLYATDVILLGNMDDIYDSLPRLFENLPSTTATFPPVTPPASLNESGMTKHGYADQIRKMMASPDDDQDDFDLVDIFGNYWIDNSDYSLEYKNGYSGTTPYAESLYSSLAAGFGYTPEQGNLPVYLVQYFLGELMRRYSLFFSLKADDATDFLEYDMPTFVNTSRLCELDVHNDSAIRLKNIANIGKTGNQIIPINGLIDQFDISTNENRSSFASMNFDITKYKIDKKTGYRKFFTTPTYINGFDGRLSDYIDYDTAYRRFSWRDASDKEDLSYIYFRFGRDKQSDAICEYGGQHWHPLMLTPARFNSKALSYRDDAGRYIYGQRMMSYCNGPLLIPENSFYFYFGLRSGHSAIDMLHEKYIDGASTSEGDTASIKCVVDKEDFTCEGDIELGNVDIEVYGLKYPISWQLMYKNLPYKTGVMESGSTLTLTDLTIGVYEIVMIDDMSREFTSYFSILNHTINLNISATVDPFTLLPHLTIMDSTRYTVNSVMSGSTNYEVVIQTLLPGTTTSGYTYNMEFDIPYQRIVDERSIEFDESVDEVQATLTIDDDGMDCVTTNVRYAFSPPDTNSITFNDVPIAYYKGWRAYDGPDSGYEDTPDDVFSGDCRFYLWDSVHTAHPGQYRNYSNDFNSLDIDDKIKYISYNCMRVFGKETMSLKNNSEEVSYKAMSISPDVSDDYYIYPWKKYFGQSKWEIEVPWQTDMPLQTGNPNGWVNQSISVPYIVGSNYPIEYDESILLKKSLSYSGITGYMNNMIIKSSIYGAEDGIFSVNFFGFKNTNNQSYDAPGKLKPSLPSTYVSDSWKLKTVSPSSGITNYFGMRTVDKRLDYEYAVLTPFTLPSVYSGMTNILMEGKVHVEQYGGFRLDYDNTHKLTSYTSPNNGPTSNAKLYGVSFYEDADASREIAYTETPQRVWQDDVDYVIYDAEGLNGKTGFFGSFTDCDTDFSNGYVSAGDTETIMVAYLSAVDVLRGTPEEYDVCYDISGATNTFTDFNGSLSGSTLAYCLNAEGYRKNDGRDEYNQKVYSNLNMDNVYRSYPTWYKWYQNGSHADSMYNGKAYETGIYVYEPTSSTACSIYSGFTTSFSGSTFEMDGEEITPQRTDEYVVSFYEDASGNTHMLEDSKIEDYVYANNEYGTWGRVNFLINATFTEASGSTLPSKAFIAVPLRRVYTSYESTQIGDTSVLRQGVAYNRGYAYYASALSVKRQTVDNDNVFTIRLFTPLRDSQTGIVNYLASSLTTQSNGWHTFGKITEHDEILDGRVVRRKYSTPTPNATISYSVERAEFTFTMPTSSTSGKFFFEIEDGLRYLVNIKA